MNHRKSALIASLLLLMATACGGDSLKKEDPPADPNAEANNTDNSKNSATNSANNIVVVNNAATNNLTPNNVSTTNGATNNGVNNGATNNISANNASTNNASTNNSAMEWESEYELLVTELTFRDDNAAQFNPLVAAALDQSGEVPLVILIDFSDVDPLDSSARFAAAPGEKIGGSVYEWVETPPRTTAYFDDSGVFDASLDEFHVLLPIEFENSTDVIEIPVRETDLSGTLFDEEPPFAVGELFGHVTRSDADEIFVDLSPDNDPIPLTALLGEENLDYDSSAGQLVAPGSASADAWHIDAEFFAEGVTIND